MRDGPANRSGSVKSAEEAIRAFADRDSEACLRLAETDDRVDELNRVVLERVLAKRVS